MSLLQSELKFLKGLGPARADALQKELSITNARDLLFHFPYRHIDRTKIYKIIDADAGAAFIQVQGTLSEMQIVGEKKARRLIANLSDDTGTMELVWFQSIKWMQGVLKPGAQYLAFGRPNEFRNKLSIAHPDLEMISGEQKTPATRMMPLYSSTELLKKLGMDSRGFRSVIQPVLDQMTPAEIPDFIPKSFLEKYKFPSRYEAIKTLHNPVSNEELNHATARMKWEELFLLQLRLLFKREVRLKKLNGFLFPKLEKYFTPFYNQHLPFALTGAQKKVLKEIRSDLMSGHQMNRLLQGDVGSGKTIVAFLSSLMAADNGFQSALMAPTEILAQQHFKTIAEFAGAAQINIALLTGSVKGKERKKILEMSASGELNLLIGTHALVEEKVQFKNLGLAIIDEQHRFGVAQRGALWQKNEHPAHVLVMTATPIPRTLAMTVYGELDVSVINELPPGRKPVNTTHRFENSRAAIYNFLKEQIRKGRQVYVVFPLIDESEKLDYAALMRGYEDIGANFPSPEFTLCMMHGRMSSEEKKEVMELFSKNEKQIMVATQVIEVGVNVPNASVMVIESAERFGLSQLHQLRGRVGRGADQSYCILMTGSKLSSEAKLRMNTMVRTNDGFEIAEVDLRLRGPGNIEGTEQSGILNLRLADLIRDKSILDLARNDAMELIQSDSSLSQSAHSQIRKEIEKDFEVRKKWAKVS